jgi:prolyl oligopeptidase
MLRNYWRGLVAVLVLAPACSRTPVVKPGVSPQGKVTYPVTPTTEQLDRYHGDEVADPYRWLEDLDSPQTAAWVQAQNGVTQAYLAQIGSRASIKKRLTELWQFERYGVPEKKGKRYFFTKNSGLENQDVLYVADTLGGEARVVVDVNAMAPDGTVALAGWEPAPDGKLVAYALQIAGSDWLMWKVRNADTGRDLPDTVKWVKFSGVAWTHDGEGFYYSRYPKPKKGALREQANYYNKLYYHRLGTDQGADRLVLERADEKEWSFSAEITEDGRYLVVSVSKGTDDRNRVLYQRLDEVDSKLETLIDHFDAAFDFLGNDGPVFYFRTTDEAAKGRIVAIDVREPGPQSWREVVPQRHDAIETAAIVGDQLFVVSLTDAHHQVETFDLQGALVREVELPGIGSVWGFTGERKDTETFFAFSSFTSPTSIFRYDLASAKLSVFAQPKVAFNPAEFETVAEFATSKDGTRVPLFVSYKKGLKLDGNNPTYLYGYGGFNVALTPWFRVATLVWMEMGGVYAVACVRGGGEYGEEWHDAGRLNNKQNGFDDFISAAEWLVAQKYTSQARLAAGGASNGGLLVGASVVQRPDLFGAALPAVGVFDMLRFHKFTIGWAWTDDYGSADDPRQYQTLRAYSPLHNVKPGTRYPAMLLTTGDHDDRVVPSHSFKFTAALQAAQAAEAPVLVRVETRTGHGRGKPTALQIDEAADQWSFLVRALGMELPQPYRAADEAVAKPATEPGAPSAKKPEPPPPPASKPVATAPARVSGGGARP